jgi:hypothetical protein
MPYLAGDAGPDPEVAPQATSAFLSPTPRRETSRVPVFGAGYPDVKR